MNRFRRKLIHLLGGITEEEIIIPKMICNNYDIKELRTSYYSTHPTSDDKVKLILCNILAEDIISHIDISKEELPSGLELYRASLFVVDKGDK